MKVVGFTQIYNEIERGNLARCFDNMARFCDEIVAYDDGSTDGSAVEMKRRGVHVVEGKHNDWLNEIDHKKTLLEVALTLQPDWIFWLDADEIVQHNATDKIKLMLADAETKGADGIDFHEINLWRSLSWHRLDSAYGDGWFCRAWKNNGELHYHPRRGHHQSQVPQGISKSVKSKEANVIHYGFSRYDRIKNKYLTYKALGQRGHNLRRLINENGLNVQAVDPAWIPEKVDLEPKPTQVTFDV